MESFNELSLPDALMKSIAAMKFTTPTPVQAGAIPSALEGMDILGTAQTGTGKTAAFGIPLVARLLADPKGTALVMTPTRELAVQVMQTIKQLLGTQHQIKTALLIGGEPMPRQIQQIKANPRVVVGTPGRINDHASRGTLKLGEVCFLVLDETDRMLDMGFSVQIDKILKHVPKNRQTLLFSATLPRYIAGMAERYLNNPVRVEVGSTSTPIAKIKQEVIQVQESDKYAQLSTQLSQREGSVIVFVKTKWGADRMAQRLRRDQHSAEAIHGDLRQNQRDKVIKGFRERKHRILVATDIAARGLDIPHIEHVINFDLPQCPEDYIHRIGRTGRAGAEGSALCLVSPMDRSKWDEINYMLNPGSAPAGFSGRKATRAKRARPYPFKGRRPGSGGRRAA